jgi:S1-C subfamily serine protease
MSADGGVIWMMSCMKRLWLFSVVLMMTAACAGRDNAPPAAGTVTTPVADLPVSASFRAQQPTGVPTAVPAEVIAAADAEYLLLTNIYERLSPSVVNIEVIVDTGNPDFFDDASGSGFIYDMQGHIITNAHVVADTTAVSVTFSDGYITPAEIVGVDPFSDLAVIRVNVEPERLLPVTIGDSTLVRVGQRAIAIGNPFGLASSMTVGIVSALGRQLPSGEMISAEIPPGYNNPSIIQVDASINPGNSGGPLLNSQGEVIGVNSAIRTESGIFEGVAFAIPARTVQRVVPELIANGEVEYAWLGITSLSAEDGLGVAALAETLTLPVTRGVLIDTIIPGSPASEAGLRGGDRSQRIRNQNVCVGGDIIVAVNDVYIANMDELLGYLVANARPGDVVEMIVVRGDQTFAVPVTLAARPTDDTTLDLSCGG